MRNIEQLNLGVGNLPSARTHRRLRIGDRYSPKNDVTLAVGSCEEFLPTLPERSVQLVVTSPPYNIGKRYERHKRLTIAEYVAEQRHVVELCAARLASAGSICWQVGNHVVEIVPCRRLQGEMSSGVSYGEQLVGDILRL